jgi:arginase
MARILVPYHIDERLDDLDLPVAPDVTVTASADAPAGADPWTTMAGLHERVADLVAAAAVRGERLVVLSGDCNTAAGTLAGLQRAGIDPAIVWFDGHGDVQTLETSTSGYVGGVSLRVLLGYRPELVLRPLGLRAVPEDRVVLVDARDLDPPEEEYLSTAAIRRCGVDAVGTDVLPDGPIYLHVDLDVVNPGELPGLRFPAPGGPSADAVARAMDTVLGTGRVVALELACTWHPGRGAADAVRAQLGAVLAGWE